MHRFTLAQCWADYAERIMPTGAGEVQVSETEQAFYAGAWAALHVATADDTRDEPTKADVDHLKRILRELEEFQQKLIEGRA